MKISDGLGYAFPGNIRELQNMVERGVISADEGGVIDLPHMLRREQLGDAGQLSLNAVGGLAQVGRETEAAGKWSRSAARAKAPTRACSTGLPMPTPGKSTWRGWSGG